MVMFVIFGVLIIIVVFVFFMLSSGLEGVFFYNIVVVVIFCLVFLLIEFKLIFLVYLVYINFKFIYFKSWCVKFNKGFFGFVNGFYKCMFIKVIEWCWVVLMIFIVLFMVSLGLINVNYVRMVFNFKVLYDFFSICIEMNENVLDSVIIDVFKIVE